MYGFPQQGNHWARVLKWGSFAQVMLIGGVNPSEKNLAEETCLAPQTSMASFTTKRTVVLTCGFRDIRSCGWETLQFLNGGTNG